MDMMISGFDIAAFATAIGSVAKMLHTDRKAESTKKALNEEVAVLKKQVEGFEKKLQAGDLRFDKQDAKMDTVISKVSDIDKNVGTILGYLKGKSEATLG